MDELPMNVDALLSGVYSPRSKGFLALIHDIGAAKTKHEEDKIVRKELLNLKEYVGSSRLSAKQIRELLLRLIYCETLGHDASFGYINAIKHAEQSAILEKKTGYLGASIFLNRNHNLVCLLINTIQKDLKSTNVVAKSTVLNVICTLVDAEKIPPLLPFIVAALKDKRVEVRKKALVTLKHVYQLSSDLVVDLDELLRSAISDRDPIVVSAALQFFHTLIKKNPSKYRGYLKVFLQVLTQIVEGKLSEYNFHGVQAPWIQIKLLNILALLGHQNKSCSESMNTTLQNMMRALPTDCNIGCAVMFECIRTSTTIYPLKPLLDLAAKKTTLFLTSSTSNLKCLGITAMTALVEVDTNYAGDEKLQQVIIKCLDDDDRTIGKKILELLYKITNSENISVICEKLLDYIRSASEQSIKIEVAKNVAHLANQYAPNITWYMETINDVIQAADNFVQDDVMHNLFKVIAAGGSEDKREIATRYLELINKTSVDDRIVQIACWVLGEYGDLIQDVCSLDAVLSLLTALLDRKFEDVTTYGWILTALAKLTRHLGVYLPEASGIVDRYRSGLPAELRQRCHEINVLARDMSLMKSVFPLSSTEEDTKVCSSLSFLDSYVANALTAGAQPYQQNLNTTQETPDANKAQELRFKPYDDPFSQQATMEKETPEYLNNKVSSAQSLPQNGKKPLSTSPPVWGPSGYTGNKIRKTREGSPESPKIAQSSSGKSSSGGVENHRNERMDTTKNVEEAKDIQSPLLFKSNVNQSPNVALFAGINSKPTFFSSRKAKASPQDDSQGAEGQTASGGSPSTSSETSQEQVTPKKLDVVEDESGTAIGEEQGCESNESGSVKEVTRIETTARSNCEHDLLLDVVGNAETSDIDASNITRDGSSEGTLQPMPVVNLDQSNAASHVEEKSQTPNDNKAVGSILDTGITETDAISEQTSSTKNGEIVPQADREYKELCIDSNIRLVTCAAYEPSELVMLLKLTNHNQSRAAIEGISLKIEPPSNLIAETSRTEMAVEKLSFLETLTKDVSMKYQYPSTRMSFKGTLRYSISQNSKLLHFEQELPARHLFRPLKMTTEQFGGKWTSTSCDVKKRIPVTSRKSCDEVVGSIAKYIHFDEVEIKGSEGILAGSVLGNDVCLLHANVLKTDIELWVKSSNKKLSEMIMKECVLACDQINKTSQGS